MECRVRLIVVVVMVLAVRPLATQTDGPLGIDHHNRLLVVRARAEGKTEACVLVVTTPHSAPAVIHRASAIGAQVLTRFDDIGYFRACLPIATFSQLRTMPGVLGVRIDTDGLQYGADQG